jgi:Fibronectin type III-like domain
MVKQCSASKTPEMPYFPSQRRRWPSVAPTTVGRVANTGARIGDDVVHLSIYDPVASISQPVRQLRGFQRVTLGPGAKQTVSLTLDNSDFSSTTTAASSR